MRNKELVVLADIHGNSLALAAVLAHAKERGRTRFFNLGDTFYGPLDPAGTWRILRELDMPAVLGNQDRILLQGGQQWSGIPVFGRTLEAIGREGLDWLGSLPETLRPEPDILLCHGTPRNDTAYLLEDVSTGLPAMRPCRQMLDDLLPEAAGCSLVLTGHSHHAGLASCDDITVVNPGSVGLPAYDDIDPPHIMASGSPHASYAVLTRTENGWNAEFSEVEYDWEAAAAQARANGREDWARWLATGMA
ncbi:metallophosphoesterase family protein [Pseudodesulfovibrio sp. S3]|uniref:metallophosphoesterase family protein n=2 Tax=unclassified Pseudodesulfovibrio TaxID=2661612 RepID=UPI000FEB98FF|nr:metallophosphoesterase family protein [Pseudodesulfovibrio sp. S3]MCJ2165728.1 metallophosphatase family protein [Pseudodesulfovibrio sp. S3-i]RWU02901.1 metallophosphoesterase [Pseudodesulfovibrio sp. S3]